MQMRPTNVILIEDNPSDAKLIQRVLTRDQPRGAYQISVATCLSAAKTLLVGDSLFDIILLDLDLPDSSGMNTLEQLLEFHVRSPIIVLTGHHDEQRALQALRRGAHDYLMKSEIVTSSTALPRIVRYTIERRNAQEQLRRTQMETLLQITGAAMHEFNNLIMILSGSIALLSQEVPGLNGSSQRIATISDALRRMTALISHLVRFTREQSQVELPQITLEMALSNIERLLSRPKIQ